MGFLLMRMKLYELLFAEGMKTDTPENYIVSAYIDNRSISLRVKDKTIDKWKRQKYLGSIDVHRSITVDDRRLWEVSNIEADEGYGPLLYDLVMELVFLKGDAGLMADRTDVSLAAKNVWSFYFHIREDVGHRPLPEDLFDETVLSERPEYLKYYYYKSETPILDALKAAGKFEIENNM